MPRKTFENEWIFDSFSEDSTFYTKRMFGGLAIFLHGRQMLLLVEPTKNGRWTWNGVMICTHFESQESLMAEFPLLKPHEILKKWLYIDSAVDGFEDTMNKVAERVEANDPRIGIYPKIK